MTTIETTTENPFLAGPGWNLTQQMIVRRGDPDLASRLQAEAKTEEKKRKPTVPTSLAPVVHPPAIPRGFRLDPLVGLIKIEPTTATPGPTLERPPTLIAPVPAVDDALLEAVATVAQRVASATGTAFAEVEEADATLERLVKAPDDDGTERVSLTPGLDFGRYASLVDEPYGSLAPKVAVILHLRRHGRERAPGVPLSPNDADAGMIVAEWLRRRRTPPPPQREPETFEETVDFDGLPVEIPLDAETGLSSVPNLGHSEIALLDVPNEEPVTVASEALPAVAPADERWTRLGSIVESSGGRVTAHNLRRLGFEAIEVHTLLREHPGSGLTLEILAPVKAGGRPSTVLVRNAP